MYKITFNLKSAISFVERPLFDGILAYCWMKEKYGEVPQKLTINEAEVESFELPLKKHEDGYFMASWLMFDESNHVEAVGSWKKRWANEHDHLTNFQGKKRKVRVVAGEFKSYNMPLVLHNVGKCWFYFDGDAEAVKSLIEKHLWGIGKKTSQGYGEIGRFEIEKVDFNPFQEIIRPIPIKQEDLKNAGGVAMRWMGWKPPYWLPQHQGFCWAEK